MNSRSIAAALFGAGGLVCVTAAVMDKPADVSPVKPPSVVTTTEITIGADDTAEQVWQKSQALYVKNSNVALRQWAQRARAKEWTESGPASEAFQGLSAMARTQAFKQWNDRVFKVAGATPDGKDRYDPEVLAGYAERQAAAGDVLLEAMVKAIK